MPPSWSPALLWSGAEDCESPPPTTATTTATTRPLLDAATATLWSLTSSERAANLVAVALRVQRYGNRVTVKRQTRHPLNETALSQIASLLDL